MTPYENGMEREVKNKYASEDSQAWKSVETDIQEATKTKESTISRYQMKEHC